jgi:hypothetical protein
MEATDLSSDCASCRLHFAGKCEVVHIAIAQLRVTLKVGGRSRAL